jgi:phage terminase large subunit GpA-like protein
MRISFWRELIKGFIDGLRPEPRLTVSEWADKYRVLTSQAAAEPGPYRTNRTPYLKEPMDKLSAIDPVQEVVVKKAAQVGFTELGNNWIGYIIHNAPGPILAVQPTEDMMKRNSKTRIAPMIEATPALRERIKSNRSRDSGNTVAQKEFPGGVLIMTGANSATALRSMPARFIMLDETDAYPADLDGEGSPIDLAQKRASTFSNKKILKISTPTTESTSVIDREFLTTDQRFYHVPCPHCSTAQILKFEQLRWEPGKYDTVYYECEHCKEAIQERFKTEMLENGEWIATAPNNASHKKVGYHLSAMYSPFGWKSWAEIVEEWELAQGNDPKLKTFVNTVLGDTWKEKTDAPEWEKLYERAEIYDVNKPSKEVVFITAGVDVQSDRLEVEVVGWLKGKRSIQVDYRVLMGDTAKKEVWDQLADIVNETWVREDGALLGCRLMCVDSGYNTSHVYNFTKKYTTIRVIPVKGQEKLEMLFSAPKAVETTKHGQKIGKVKVWSVGVSYIKSELYGWLRQTQNIETKLYPDGYCHLPKREPHYFRGLTAEVLQLERNKRGYLQYVWVKKYERNEPLDCRVYARAAAAIVGMDRWNEARWDLEASVVAAVTKPKRQKIKQQKQSVKETSPATKNLSKKSSFWNRN